MQAEHTTESFMVWKPLSESEGSVPTVSPAISTESGLAVPSQPVGSVVVACLLISGLFHSLNNQSSKNLKTLFKKTKVGGNQN